MNDVAKPQDILDAEILESIQPFSGMPEELTPTAVLGGGQALQQVKTDYVTAVAVQKPRSIARVAKNVIEEARMAGAGFYFSWPQGGKQIEGLSIDGAMCFARNYGNCVIDVDDQENASHYKFKAYFIDLESGFTSPRKFRQRKGQKVSKKMDSERQEDIVYQIGQSKAIRNAILRVMPEWLKAKVIQAAKQAEIAGIKEESPALARARVLEFFEARGISQDRVEATGLSEGRVSADELFPVIDYKPDPQTLATGESEQPQAETGVCRPCPNGDDMLESYCNTECKSREGCPSWAEEDATGKEG